MLTITRMSRNSLTLRCDPAMIEDLIWILEKLLMMSKYLKQHIRYAEAEARAQDPARQAALQAKFDALSRKVYHRYSELLKAGRSRAEAVKTLRKDFKIGHYDVEIYVSQGRRLAREDTKQKVRAIAQAGGYSIPEIAALFGLSYNTVKKYIEEDSHEMPAVYQEAE